MTPREEWDARIKATLDRTDEVLARSDAVIDRGIDDQGNYVPIEDDPTVPTAVPTWRELEARLTADLAEGHGRVTEQLARDFIEGNGTGQPRGIVNDHVTEEIQAHYQPHRRNWRWVFALVGLIVCVVLFALIAAYVINGAEPAPVQNWSGEF